MFGLVWCLVWQYQFSCTSNLDERTTIAVPVLETLLESRGSVTYTPQFCVLSRNLSGIIVKDENEEEEEVSSL